MGLARSIIDRWRNERQPRSAVARHAADPATFGQRGAITVARIIGNDLFPRHATGQALRNLQFILEQEAALPECRKLFVLNRIFDEPTLQEATRLVREYGHDMISLPFVATDYAALACDTSFFGGDGHFMTEQFAARHENEQDRERIWACAEKIRYAMNVNGARNAALDWAKSVGSWTLVLDGGCFVSAEAWRGLREDLSAQPLVPYVVISMQRLACNDDALGRPPMPNKTEEPQLALHESANLRFNPAYPYGMRDKTSLLDRIGVSGPWNYWKRLPWLPDDAAPAPDTHLFKYSTNCVYRLTSGVAGGALEHGKAQSRRYQARNKAIMRTLAMLDERFDTADRLRARDIMNCADASTRLETR